MTTKQIRLLHAKAGIHHTVVPIWELNKARKGYSIFQELIWNPKQQCQEVTLSGYRFSDMHNAFRLAIIPQKAGIHLTAIPIEIK